jgi:co-chaperonin GroES (HSP10)
MTEIISNFFTESSEPEVEVPATHSAFEPLNDLILLRRVVEDNSKAGKEGVIHIPQKFQQQSNKGIVISVGDKVIAELKPGDRVLFGRYNAEDLIVMGKSLFLLAKVIFAA